MKTVSKALSLLSQFSESAEPRSLGVMAETAGLDKATTRRMLVSLVDFGMVEQVPATREYTLGPGVLPLARSREAYRPLQVVAQDMIAGIARDTGETTHFSVAAQHALSVLCVAESSQPIRVHISEGALLPLHSSGAGIAYLSASPDRVVSKVLSSDLPGSAKNSYTTPERVLAAIKEAQTQGVAITSQTHDEDVCGIAIPVRAGTGTLVGAIGVATPLHRMDEKTRTQIVARLKAAAGELARLL